MGHVVTSRNGARLTRVAPKPSILGGRSHPRNAGSPRTAGEGRLAYARAMDSIRVALAQIAPSLGQLDANLARHHELIEAARTGGADLVVFPELGLTGYQLQDLAAEVSLRLDDPRLAGLARATEGLSVVVSFVEESADHRLFIAAALLEDGELRHVHRKLFLPTYGLFDERRFFAPGRPAAGRAVAPRRGDRDRGVRGLLAPDRAADPGPRRRADPHQRVVVSGAGPGRHERGRTGDGDVLADAHADVRPAHDVVRHLLQPGGRGRIDLVLGRVRGHRPDRRGRAERPALRRGPVHDRYRPGGHPPRADRPPAPARRAAGAPGARAGADRARASRTLRRHDERARAQVPGWTSHRACRRRDRSGSARGVAGG